MQDMLLILNFDSRYASTVAIKLRAERIDCRILPGDTPFEKVVAQGALGLVLAGGVTGEIPATLDGRLLSAGIPVLALVGGSCGAFGGMGIVAKLCSAILMSEEGRLALSGPEVIETVMGVEEFDAKDRALVWRVTGGKHRYLMGDCAALVDDDIADFRNAAGRWLAAQQEAGPALASLRAEQARLENRLAAYADYRDGLEVWAALGVEHPDAVPLLDRQAMAAIKEGLPA